MVGSDSIPDKVPVVLVGDAFKQLKKGEIDPENHPVFRCAEVLEQVEGLLPTMGSCVLVLRSGFLESFPASKQPQLLTGVAVVAVGDEDDEAILRLLQKGCRGVLSPNLKGKMLRRAITCIAAGEYWAPRRVLSTLIEQYFSEGRVSGLTVREHAVLRLVRQGHTNREIADRLSVSRETIRWYLRELGNKMGPVRGSGEHKSTAQRSRALPFDQDRSA